MKTALIFELRLFIESASELQLLKLVEVLSRERKEIARKAEKSISTTAFIKPDGFSAYLHSNQESAAAVLSNSNRRKQKELLNFQANQPPFDQQVIFMR
jgi:hypothetical protein